MKKLILTIVTIATLFSCSPEDQATEVTLNVSDVEGVLYCYKTQQWFVPPVEYGDPEVFSEKIREECPDEWNFNTSANELDIQNNNYNRVCDTPMIVPTQDFSTGVGVVQIGSRTYTFDSTDAVTITLTHYYESDQYIVYYFFK